MSDRTEAKIKAKTLMRGMTFALWFTTFLVTLPVSIISSINGASDRILTEYLSVSKGSYILYVVSVALSALMVAAILLTIPLRVGLTGKYLHVARGGRSSEKSVWDAYRNKDIAEPIKANLLAGLYIFLWSLLFVIPGIVAAMRYSMLNLVFADNPGIDYRSAMDKCKAITKGRKGKIFVFYLSYIGWDILVGLTFGILSIYVVPYENTAFAALYDMWNPKQPPVIEEKEEPKMRSDFPYFDYTANNDSRIVF